MFEKVNPSHPDKIADRIAGAFVDYAYSQSDCPKVAVEVLIGHGECNIIAETSVNFPDDFVDETVTRIAEDNNIIINYREYPQDEKLAKNQEGKMKCGDNGIFKGFPKSDEQSVLSRLARQIYRTYPYDGKYVIDNDNVELIICQSHALADDIEALIQMCYYQRTNPLGYWEGGLNTDTGATNRKLGSDMGDAATGGGLHGKDLSKADVSVNIYAHLEAQKRGEPVELYCAIGDDTIDGKPYEEIVNIAKDYVKRVGGFEKLAEWGLI